MAAEQSTGFAGAVRSAGILTAGRQFGAVIFTGSVLLLSRYVDASALNPFLWIYFAQLLVSSILNLGLERYTARQVAGAADDDRPAILGSALLGRAATALFTPIAILAVLAFVHVPVPTSVWFGAAVWTLAVQFQGVLFAALRAAGSASAEAGVAFGGRIVQGIALLVVARAGRGLGALVWTCALVDVAVLAAAVIVAASVVGVSRSRVLPYRTLAIYAVLEMSVFAYLRADLLIVGRLLGTADGATYGLGYRVVDALAGLATPAVLVLFAYASAQAARGTDMSGIRRRSQALLPQLGVALAAIAIASVAPLGALLPRLHDAEPALRILLATIPLTYLIGVEAHLLSAEDRNLPVIVVSAGALIASVVLNIVVVPRFGMVGAAAILMLTEAGQVVGLAWGARATGSTRGATRVLGPAGLLLLGGFAMNHAVPLLGIGLLAAAVAVSVVRFRAGLPAAVALVHA